MAYSKKNKKGKHNVKPQENEKTEGVNEGANKQDKKPPKIFYLLLVLIPVLFFFLLEIGLRVFGYGYNDEQWTSLTETKLMMNHDIARRYFFTTGNLPYSIQDSFDKIKADNAFRIFVLGESSAAGFPYMPNGSFSRYLQQRLERVYPRSKIEVINLGLTAINSYTIKDLIPGVLEQKPDLILIYTGHNEYYGALGVGSIESFGNSRMLTKVILSMNKLKTVQFLRNLIKDITGIFSNEKPASDQTLMARIAKEQYIEYNSDIYNDGIEQFRENMADIFELIKEKGIPVIIGTLISNLKDQPPFISVKSKDLPPADNIYNEGKMELNNGNTGAADSLFRYAKDLDVLRFRAPGKINLIIKELANKYNFICADFDSAFSEIADQSIIGDDLMTDHLHPTLNGYHLMGKFFYETMASNNLLPRTNAIKYTYEIQDSLTKANFYFSKLDSVIANQRIIRLKNDWPFVKGENLRPLLSLMSLNTTIDSLAYRVVNENLNWETAHRTLAVNYLSEEKLDLFTKEMNVLIAQYPVIVEYYDFTANEYLKRSRYNEAFEYLKKRYLIKPDVFSSKWIGIINLAKNDIDRAVFYLEKSREFNNSDPQVLYNLAGAYTYKKEYKKALDLVDRCLSISPNYADAKNLKEQLLKNSK